MARRALASVFIEDDPAAFVVAETPHEVRDLVAGAAPDDLIELTLANAEHEWNGRAAFVRARRVVAITPPRSLADV